MSLTDEELNREWDPKSQRPQSAIARNFEQELGELFNLDGALGDLDTKFNQREEKKSKESQELADLDARIREMDQRLKLSGQQNIKTQTIQEEEPADDSKSSRSRPGTARPIQKAPGSGDMPPTPGASEDGNGE